MEVLFLCSDIGETTLYCRGNRAANLNPADTAHVVRGQLISETVKVNVTSSFTSV